MLSFAENRLRRPGHSAPVRKNGAVSGSSRHTVLRLQRAPDDRDAPTPARAGRSGHDFGSLRVYGSAPGAIPPGLRMSTPGDPAEREAEAVAERVMRMPEGAHPAAPGAPVSAGAPALQRMCSECGEEERGAEGRGAPSAEEELEGRVASEMQALEGGGSPLPGSSRAFFEPRFGHDFAGVRVHTDARAARLARSVSARAFTLGRNIVFGSGEYSPQTGEGRHVLAHELAHVVQQEGRGPQLQRLTITQHSLTKSGCGGWNVQWIFSLDKPAPEDGYIVQKVERHELVSACPDVLHGPPGPLPPFWEAWFVKKGDKLDWLAATMKYTDGSVRPARAGMNGSYIAMGTVKFYTKSVTGDLGRDGVAPSDPKSTWGPGKVPISGALPSTASEPSWWTSAPTEGPAERGVWASWNCCDADKAKHLFDLKTKP